jgi:superfamily II DNA or RNA helicase
MTATAPIISASVRIPKSSLHQGEREKIQRDLTFSVKSDGRYGFDARPRSVFMYDDSGDWLTVPRAYGLHVLRDLRSLAGVAPVDMTSAGTSVDFSFNEDAQKARPAMKAVQDKLVAQTVKKLKGGIPGGILSAPCGTGKTVMGCKVAYEMGVTTLILAHKEFLVDQWRDRISMWLNIPKEEIGIVQQDRCEYHGRRIVVAMLQSIVEREYAPGLYSWPGLVIADEVHRHGADLWHKAAMKFTSKYRLGLTATPTRKDGMWDVVRNNFGEILAQDSGEAMQPTVYVVKYRPNIDARRYCWLLPSPAGYLRIKKVYLGKFLTLLARDERRNSMIVKIILKAAHEGRKVLLLTDRREHIEILKKMVADADKTITVGRYVGGMSAAGRELSEKCQVILGTFQMAQEALDIPALDVGILATPHSDVEQPAGRICRQMDGKKQPVLVDILDVEPRIGEPFFMKRQMFYDSRGWPIRYV